MHITDMHITPVAMGDPPLLNAAGLHAPYALRTIVELVTNDGISGIGEVHGGVSITNDLEAARDLVIGKDPFALTTLAQDFEQRYARRAPRIYSPVEVACLDIIGKAINRPVCDLLGGKVRDAVPFSAYLFFKYAGAGGQLAFESDPQATGWSAARQAEALDPDAIVRQAQAMCQAFGFKSIKLKAGALPPDVEVASILALREAFGEHVPLRIDPNAVWSLSVALECGRKMCGALEYYEDPVRGQAAMGELARVLDIPLATNMCTVSFADLPGSVQHGSEHIILSDHHFWGGLRASIELARFCRSFGRGLSMHSNSHLGISLAAMTHLAAAVPNLTYACDTHYPWQWEDCIVTGRFEFDQGMLAVPHGPGLGIELDHEALAVLHQQYLACGLTERNDEIEMQKVEPGWTFQATRW